MRLIRVGLVYLRSRSFAWRNGRGCGATTPDRHFAVTVQSAHVPSIDRGVNSAHWKYAFVFPSQNGQIGGLCGQLFAKGAISFPAVPVARCAMGQILRLGALRSCAHPEKLTAIPAPAIRSDFIAFSIPTSEVCQKTRADGVVLGRNF